MPIPTVYRKEAEAALASYDYVDIASGTGFVTFYGGRVSVSGANVSGGFVLRGDKFYSDLITTYRAGNAANQAFTNIHELDFDIDFKRPMTVHGLLLASVPYGLKTASAAKQYEAKIQVLVRKWDGTTETEIANNYGDVLQVITAIEWLKMGAIDVNVPKTHFKAEETLRITVIYWGREAQTGADTFDSYLGHDPQGRTTADDETVDWGTDVTVMSFQVPFVIKW